MEIMRKAIGVLALLVVMGSFTLFGQTNELRHIPRDFSLIPLFTNNPAALELITNLLNESPPELVVPEVCPTNVGPAGTYWTLSSPIPLPGDMFPGLPTYKIGTDEYLLDDRSVDYAALDAGQSAQAEAEGLTNPPLSIQNIDTNGLWLQVPTNALATPHSFLVNAINTIQGQPYDILTKADLLAANWATELTVTGAVGNVTPAQILMAGRTNLFVWARTSVRYSFYVITQPLSQDVFDGDLVTFRVDTGGNTNLTFQWTFDGSTIPGATNNTYTIRNVQDSDMGYYACIISDGTGSLITTAAQLTTEGYLGDTYVIPLVSDRQDYVFQSGLTYYIGSPIQLHGNTVIQAGAVLKFDFDNSTDSSLIVKGGLTCQTEPYNPAILTSYDDDADGEWFFQSSGSPQAYISGIPYLDLTAATSNRLSNLRFCFADWGVTTPVNSPMLDVWDCQFVGCNYGIVNLVAGSSMDSLHNVLFANCEAGIGASSNSITIQGEQVTADVADFCLSAATPARIALTNSLIWGNPLTASSVVTANVEMNPDNTNFTSSAQGNYYLAANSPLHQAGTAGISPRLQTEFKNKTTYAPMSLTANLQISGQITLASQVSRYTNGPVAPGYWYDALDYTVASLYLTGGSLTVLPGTAVGVRNDPYPDGSGTWTIFGIYVSQGGTVTSHGTPNHPNVFTAVGSVQETPNMAFAEVLVVTDEYNHHELPGVTTFATDFEPGETAAPTLDFRFSNFYLPALSQHFCSGLDYEDYWIFSASSTVNLHLQDCSLHGGSFNLGQPDYYDFAVDQVFGGGTVTWNNTLFENVSINLDPTFYEIGGDDLGLNVDLSFQAGNNLFKGGQWFHLEPIPASAGNWAFKDNLFDHVNLIQDSIQPLDFDYNGYWPLPPGSVAWNATVNPWNLANTNYLQNTITMDGFVDGHNEQFLTAAPPYRGGAFGNYYLSATTALYQAGSRLTLDAGLTQYTTFVSQSKDASNQPVNIGLHYVASTNALPLDSDGDGVPDYVETEHGTDLNNAMTDGVTNDAYNVAYDDVDLSGNGLVGRIKKALGENPLDPRNPMTLSPMDWDEKWGIATFEMPISYNTLTNIGNMTVFMNGVCVTLEDFSPATNGNTLISWNTTYNSSGQHFLQPSLSVKMPADDGATLTAPGTVVSYTSKNPVRFYENDAIYDAAGAYLDAQIASTTNQFYSIQIFDPSTTPATFIKGITNSTSNGIIQEDWDLKYDDGVTSFSGDTFDAVFTVSDSDLSTGGGAGYSAGSLSTKKRTKRHTKTKNTEQGNSFDFAYMYTPSNAAMANDFGDFDIGAVGVGMQNVVDTLLTPVTVSRGGYADHYDSAFNNYTSEGNNTHGNGLTEGWPGYLTSQAAVNGSLFTTMTNGDTKNFFVYAHGGGNSIGDYNLDVTFFAPEVAGVLDNYYSGAKIIKANYPYRFVFLDGCSTASTPEWREAFGIFPLWDTNSPARSKIGPQAFVGWGQPVTGWLNPHDDSVVSENVAFAYTEALADMYEFWMENHPLSACIDSVSSPAENIAPFPVSGLKGKSIHVWGDFGIDGSPFDYIIPASAVKTSPIYIVGHSGLTRGSLRTEFDNNPKYNSPIDVK